LPVPSLGQIGFEKTISLFAAGLTDSLDIGFSWQLVGACPL